VHNIQALCQQCSCCFISNHGYVRRYARAFFAPGMHGTIHVDISASDAVIFSVVSSQLAPRCERLKTKDWKPHVTAAFVNARKLAVRLLCRMIRGQTFIYEFCATHRLDQPPEIHTGDGAAPTTYPIQVRPLDGKTGAARQWNRAMPPDQ
jgi:hypothetical protein